jgi:hypothetical protein
MYGLFNEPFGKSGNIVSKVKTMDSEVEGMWKETTGYILKLLSR